MGKPFLYTSYTPACHHQASTQKSYVYLLKISTTQSLGDQTIRTCSLTPCVTVMPSSGHSSETSAGPTQIYQMLLFLPNTRSLKMLNLEDKPVGSCDNRSTSHEGNDGFLCLTPSQGTRRLSVVPIHPPGRITPRPVEPEKYH